MDFLRIFLRTFKRGYLRIFFKETTKVDFLKNRFSNTMLVSEYFFSEPSNADLKTIQG